MGRFRTIIPGSRVRTEASDHVSARSRETFIWTLDVDQVVAVADDVEEPDEPVGGLPDHAVADRAKGVVSDDLRGRPGGFAFLLARAEDVRLGGVFSRAAVIDQVEVAVVEFGGAGRVLVWPGRYLGAEDPLDPEVARERRRGGERPEQGEDDETAADTRSHENGPDSVAKTFDRSGDYTLRQYTLTEASSGRSRIPGGRSSHVAFKDVRA